MCRHSPPRHRPHVGFTLIELLVVVVIIAILAAVVLPGLLEHLQNQEGKEAAPVARIAQAAPSASVASVAPSAVPPVIESSDIQVKLDASPVLEGMQVYTRYDAAFTGTFVVRNADPSADELRLHFPFPPGISEARDVSLKLLDAAGQAQEAAGATYEIEGIRWAGRVAPGQSVAVVVSYSARGREAFVYDVTGKGRAGAVRVEVLLANAGTPMVPPDSLQPTEVGKRRILWNLKSLVATRPLVVELPAGTSPLGQLILLCKLAALGVLLFGGGFWYLSELRRPGSLDSFRWGHFLLLALNYSTFFVTFAVVGYRGQVAVALALAVVVSQPLLALHVARLADVRFALGKVLPLSLVTLAAVVAGVYAEAQRPYVFLALALVVVTYVTWTYRRWAEGRTALLAARKAERERAGREEMLAKARRELEQKVDAGAELAQRAATLVTEPGEGAQWERARVQAALDKLEAVLREARGEKQAGPAEAEAHRAWVKAGAAEAGHQTWRVEAATGDLQEALGQLEQKLQRARRQAPVPKNAQVREGVLHCRACGAVVPGHTKYCPECGALGAELIACRNCGTVLELPSHLLARAWPERGLHCSGCGEALPVPPLPPRERREVRAKARRAGKSS